MAAELSYNGVTFTALYRTSVNSRPLQDEARRTTIAVEHTIEVNGFLTGGTNQTMEDLRRLLTAQAGELKYSDHGFGTTFHVNGTSEVRDAVWGPRTELVSFQPLGGDGQAAKVQWRVIVTIPECQNAKYEFGLMALNYTVSFDIDGEGYTTARVSGYLEIPMTRKTQSDRIPPDSADRYRERLEARTVLLGYRRTKQMYLLSQDRRRIDFSYTDEQLPAPLPRKVVKIDMKQSIRSKGLALAKMWNVNYQAVITLAAGVPKAEALGVFLSLIASRHETVPAESPPMWTDLEIEDNVFGRESRFTLSIRHTKARFIDEILSDYSMWRSFRDVDWESWRKSMYDWRVFKSRGFSELRYNPTEDAIIDLCDTPKTVAGPVGKPPPNDRTLRPGVPNRRPPRRSAKDSWLDYRCYLRWVENQNIVRHKPLPSKPLQPGPGNQPARGGSLRQFDTPRPSGGSSTNALQEFPGKGGALQAFPQSRTQAVAPIATGSDVALDTLAVHGATEARTAYITPDIVQKAAGATRTAQLIGWGVRLGYRVAPPKLLSLSGSVVFESHKDVFECVIGNINDEPIYMTMWMITYMVPEAPSDALPTPGNPWLDVSGSGSSVRA